MDKELKRLQQSLIENQKTNYNGARGEKLKKLVTEGQKPPFFFISCSDSRYDPNLFPGMDNGDVFLAEHIAALVPPYDAPEAAAVAAAVDYAVHALKVKHIIIMGHTHCGGVKGLVEGGTPGAVGKWLDTAKDALKTLPKTSYKAEKCSHAEKSTVRWSLENLKKYPAVAAALKAGDLEVHGWRYDIENGHVQAWNDHKQDFTPFFDPKAGNGNGKKPNMKPPGR